MKYLMISLLVLMAAGCSKSSGELNGRLIQYKDSFFSDTLTVFNGEREKSYQYDELKTVEDLTKTGQETISDTYGCNYYGYCFYMGKFQSSAFCSGSRAETREYKYYDVKSKVNVIRNGKTILSIKKPDKKRSSYNTLKRGHCS